MLYIINKSLKILQIISPISKMTNAIVYSYATKFSLYQKPIKEKNTLTQWIRSEKKSGKMN